MTANKFRPRKRRNLNTFLNLITIFFELISGKANFDFQFNFQPE